MEWKCSGTTWKSTKDGALRFTTTDPEYGVIEVREKPAFVPGYYRIVEDADGNVPDYPTIVQWYDVESYGMLQGGARYERVEVTRVES
jgi:hypothetical protein